MNSTAAMKPLKRFFNLLKEEKNQVYGIYFYAIINGLVALSLPLGIQAILNFILGGRITTSWVLLVIVVAIGVAFGGYLQISQLQITEKLQQRIFSKAGLSIAYRLPRVKAEILHGKYGPEVVNRFFDTINLQKGISKLLVDFTTAVLQMVFGLLLLSFYHPTFIVFGAGLITILILIFYYTSPKGMETALKESSYKYQTAYWLQEIGRTLNTFKLVGSTNLPILRADRLIQRYVDFRSKHFAVLILQYKIMVGFKVLIVTSLLVAGSVLLINEQISIGQFVAAEVVIVLVINSVEKVILSLETVYDTLVAVEKLGTVMDLELERSEDTDKLVVSKPEGLKFGMQDVVFQPRDANKPILNGVNLLIKPGRKVAITGKSGSGKSALLALFAGLYEDFKGKVLVNDLSIDMIQLEKYRAMVGDCLEFGELFQGTIKENILLGRDVLPEQFELILDLVGLKDYIYQMPADLETELQPEGKGLSRAIAQSILIARSLVGNPKAIIMENALRNINPELKPKIADYLMSGDWTLAMVTDDPVILQKADEIIVMDAGKVGVQGSYEDYLQYSRKNS
ncbi:ABC-type bacteriocin/lantibiotic exporter with double-glycine peptidase domain [Algoriphagus iocasae]|jgi:ABC-type bacteriocin/lantibiotic exporter with double-glycine peptidase domain|uniref:ABC-type bacteriocin/lantibiotic exporter with double-glycine peptidase domain n=1 Tax=Algoriphagus iocasae TaxID=1836499 RepID=A0A841N2B4_9BACT|nr:ATP-binding cassette domain-containing protein [Algoriphagus iocasae]MBB6328311.1 ABC-type bacteriocin/lantibiotic exporter with double-glycine peptidase domain [Algoriphagus iocasae]